MYDYNALSDDDKILVDNIFKLLSGKTVKEIDILISVVRIEIDNRAKLITND